VTPPPPRARGGRKPAGPASQSAGSGGSLGTADAGPPPALLPGPDADAPAAAAAAPLTTALAVVRDTWRDQRGDALDAAEAARVLEWLGAAALRAARGEVLERGGPAASTLGRHLVELVRAEVLRGRPAADAPSDREEILRVLDALERVREATDPDWSAFFNSRLTGPDGLELVIGVAHDIRSPLTSILFLADTLGRGQSGGLNDLQKRQLRLIYSAALGLSSLASDVIELARGGDHLVDREPEPFSLAEVLETLHSMVQPIAEEKGLQVRYNVPPSERRLGRPLALSRVLLNLTTNALKYTDEGFVEITTRAKGMARVEFSVRDTGRGISPEVLASLYQPFRRSRSRTGGRKGFHFSGTGLGLAMCRKLVEAMGSELAYESRPEWGTRFYFEVNLPPSTVL
jgi:signal transduction histidine kinase